MNCSIVPDNILKTIKDIRSLKISKKLRGLRLKKTLMELVGINSKRITFDAKNTTNLPGIEVARDLEITKNADDLAQIAHIGAKQVHDWLMIKFGRDSYDAKGATLKSTVNYGDKYSNAFWNSSQMVYGSGDGRNFLPFVKDLTVVGHELSHALIEHTAGLVYWGESGALNESFADVFGISFSHWVKGSSDPKTANWMIGSDCVGPDFPGKAIRTFTLDKAYKGDPQPNTYKTRYWGFSDQGGVHINSKLGNRVFYIFCQETNHASYEQPVHLWYNCLLKLTKRANFKGFSKALTNTCIEMFDKNSPEHKAVLKGLKEVGI